MLQVSFSFGASREKYFHLSHATQLLENKTNFTRDLINLLLNLLSPDTLLRGMVKPLAILKQLLLPT